LHDGLGDLPRGTPPDLDRPRTSLVVEVRGRRGVRRVALEPVRDLRVREREVRRLLLVEPRLLARDGLSCTNRSQDEREGRQRGDDD
jgi:hypothetical protein